MIEELIAAAAVGSALGNAWVCALVSLSCSIDSKKGGIAFIGGRFLGLFILGAAIAGLGLVEDIDPTYFVLVFGIMTTAMGTFVLLRVLTRRHWLKHGAPMWRFLHRRMHHGQRAMADGGEIKFETDSPMKISYVFILGVVRGATPCVKTMVLAPLLLSVDFPMAIAMVMVFAVASTIYPVIGFLSGNIIRQSKRHAHYMKIGAALLMIVLGVYFILNAFTAVHGGGID